MYEIQTIFAKTCNTILTCIVALRKQSFFYFNLLPICKYARKKHFYSSRILLSYLAFHSHCECMLYNYMFHCATYRPLYEFSLPTILPMNRQLKLIFATMVNLVRKPILSPSSFSKDIKRAAFKLHFSYTQKSVVFKWHTQLKDYKEQSSVFFMKYFFC